MRELDPANEDERDLLRRLKSGCDAAYEELVRRHGPALLRLGRRFFRSEDDARDVVQDAFLQAFRGLPRFAGEASLHTWLHRITVNAALMRLRARRRRPEVSMEALLAPERAAALPPALSVEPSAPRALLQAEARRLLRASLERLPEDHRRALELRHLEGCRNREAAERLGISETAMKLRVHRARRALADLVAPALGRPAPAP